jgi:hypothetical protein
MQKGPAVAGIVAVPAIATAKSAQRIGCARVQSFVASRHPRQQSVNSRSLDEHHKFIRWRVYAASLVSG